MNRWVSRLGAAIAIASIAGLLVFAYHNAQALPPIRWDLKAALGALAAIGIYLLTLLSAALAWYVLLHAQGEQLGPKTALMIVLVSQVAKYLPGNVGHYLGRIALGREQGLPTATVLFTLGVEAGCAVAAGTIVSAAAFPLAGMDFLPAGTGRWRFVAFLASSALAILGIWLLGAAKRRHSGGANDASQRPRALAMAALICVGFAMINFLLFATSAILLARTVLGVPPPPVLALGGAFAAAWVAGFLTPGAPAGLGVREAVLVVGLSPISGSAVALTLPLLFRVLTTLGDGVGFALGMLLRRSQGRAA